MKLVIDRFEGEYAICENDDNEIINININELAVITQISFKTYCHLL